MTIKTPNFQIVELVIPTTIVGANNSIYFQQQPQLQSTDGHQIVYIKAIETYSDQAVTNSPITTNNPVASADNIKNAVLVLNLGGTLRYQMIPLASMNRILQSPGAACPGVIDLFMLRNAFNVDWTKSYVTCVQQPINPPFSFLFGVHYSYEPDQYDF